MRKRSAYKKNKKIALLKGCAIALTLAVAFLIPGLVTYAVDAHKQKTIQKSEISKFSQINNDYVCDLVVPQSSIRFPVVQAQDNQKYLDTAFTGEKNMLGAIFMDYRCVYGEEPHIIIYGHDAKDYDGNLLMFGFLRNYLQDDFFEEHPTIELVRNQSKKSYRVFDIKITDVNDAAYCLDFSEDYRFEEFAHEMGAPPHTREILTLSTCLGEGDSRLVLQGALTGN